MHLKLSLNLLFILLFAANFGVDFVDAGSEKDSPKLQTNNEIVEEWERIDIDEGGMPSSSFGVGESSGTMRNREDLEKKNDAEIEPNSADGHSKKEEEKRNDEGIFNKKLPKNSVDESKKFVEKILENGSILEIKFFVKIAKGNEMERKEIGQIMEGENKEKKNELIEKEAKRGPDEIQKISRHIHDELWQKYAKYVDEMVDEKTPKERQEKMLKWHYECNKEVVGAEKANENEKAKKNFEGRIEMFKSIQRMEEKAAEKKKMTEILLGHSLEGIVDKFVGHQEQSRKQLIGWFVLGKGSGERAKIVENGNAEERIKCLVDFFRIKGIGDLVEEMEKEMREIANPENMTWKKAVQILNYERILGKNAKKLREEEIEKIVREISEGNEYQKIEMFSIFVDNSEEKKREREKLEKILTNGSKKEKDKLIQRALKRTERERKLLVGKFREEMEERKKKILEKYIHKKVEEKERREMGGGEEMEEEEILDKEEEGDLDISSESEEEKGDEEKLEEENEEREKLEMSKEKLVFLKRNFKVYAKSNLGWIPFRRSGRRNKWVREAREFMEEVDSLIEKLAKKGENERGDGKDIGVQKKRASEDEEEIKVLALKMMTEDDVEHSMENYIESTGQIRGNLVKEFIEWVQQENEKKNENIIGKILIEGTKEAKKEQLAKFIGGIKRRDLLARIMAKTAYGLRVDHEYMQKLIPRDQYFLPPDIKGFVVRIEKKGLLRSSNAGIDHLLQYLQIKAHLDLEKAKKRLEERMAQKEKIIESKTEEDAQIDKKLEKHLKRKQELYDKLWKAEIPKEKGCYLALRVSSKMRHYAFLFDEAVTIPQPDIEKFLERFDEEKLQKLETGAGITREEIDEFLKKHKEPKMTKENEMEEEEEEEEEDERYTQITTYILLEIIQKGKRALGKNTELNWKNLAKVENRARTGSMWKKLINFIKNIVKFVRIMQTLKNMKRTNKSMKQIGKELGEETAKVFEKENAIFDNVAKRLKEMQDSKFVQNDETHERLTRQTAQTFDFLRQVRYEFETLPGDIVDSRREIYTKIIEKIENQKKWKPKYSAEEIKTLNKGGYRIGEYWQKKHWEKHSFPDKENKRKYEQCEELRQAIDAVMYPRISSEKEEQEDPVHYELRGRSGANILLSIMNTKKLTRDMLIGLGLSLVGSGTVALILDVGLLFVVTVILTALSPATGGFTLVLIPIFAFLIPTFTPLVAETVDSFIIKRLMGLSRGKPFWPKTKAEFKRNIKEALVAGGIATIGSAPFNALAAFHIFGGWAWLPAKALANFLGTATSASMVPLEVEKMGGHTGASILMKMEDGFLAKPDTEKIVENYEQKMKKHWINLGKTPSEDDPAWKDLTTRALQAHIKKKTDRVMRVAKASAQAISSLGTGATLSFLFGFLLVAIPGEFGWLPETIIEVDSVFFNTPTEAWSMTMQTLTGEGIGLNDEQKMTGDRKNHFPRKWLSRDSTKNAQMLQLIFQKTKKQIEHKLGKAVPIKYEQIHQVYRPILEYTSPFGEWIVNAMRRIVFFVRFATNLKENLDVSGLEKSVKSSGLVDEAETIVENWQENMVYVIQRPRTSTAPSLAPSDLKLETWLKFRKIPFYRLTNARFFTALFNEQLPIVEFRGEQIVGSVDEIIRELDFKMKFKKLGDPEAVLNFEAIEIENKEKAKELKEKEKKTRKLVDKVLNRILMYDRQYTAKKNAGCAPLKFVRNDAGILKQLKEAENRGDWAENLKNIFKSDRAFIQKRIGLDGALDMMRLRLQIYQLEPEDAKFIKKVKKVTYSELKPDEIVTLLKRTMEKIEKQLTESRAKVIQENEAKKEEQGTSKREHINYYLFGEKPTIADASLFAHLVLFTNLNTPGMREYFEELLGDSNSVLRIYIEQIKRNEWGRMHFKEQIQVTDWEHLKMDPYKKLNFDFEWIENWEKINDFQKFDEGNAPFGLLPDEVLPAEKESAETSPIPREVMEMDIGMENVDRKLFDNPEFWIKNEGEEKKNEIQMTRPLMDSGSKIEVEGEFREEQKFEQTKSVPNERIWARELVEFKNLPLPELTNNLEINEVDDARLLHFPPLLRPILVSLFQIGTGTYLTAANEPFSKELVEIAKNMMKNMSKNRKELSSFYLIRGLLRLTAAFLCKNEKEEFKEIDGKMQRIDHCGNAHYNEARNEFTQIGSEVDSRHLQKELQIFVWHKIFQLNEQKINKQLTKIGNNLVRHVRIMNGKIQKWMHRKEANFLTKAKKNVQQAIWRKVLSILDGKTDKIFLREEKAIKKNKKV